MTPHYTALIVDDENLNQLIAQKFLENSIREKSKKNILNIHVADNGAEAVDMCKKTLYDIVLMDAYMPVLNGIEATKQLKELNYQAPIIGYTAADPVLHDELLQAGMKDVISKPIFKDRLHEILEQYVFNSD